MKRGVELVELEHYAEFVKKQRIDYFEDDKPYNLIFRLFEESGYTKKEKAYFFKNASRIVEDLRQRSWDEFTDKEKSFTQNMLSVLYEEEDLDQYSSAEAISWFVQEYPTHIYQLNLSNTQSRRSRAGKEFEAIIELILMGADVPLDSQGNIGQKYFTDRGIGKMVDIVSPGAVEYEINKRNTILISAKTTLRERWQEVSEEMVRTGAREMFLITLDSNISDEVINNLNTQNIQIVTTSSVKRDRYSNYGSVMSFEEFMEIIKNTVSPWENYTYPAEEKERIINNLKKQLKKHKNHSFVKEYYQRWIDKFEM